MRATWRFFTLLLVSLSMGLAFCHALEMPAKLDYDPSLYLTLHRSLYRHFGAPIGAFLETGAVVGSVVLAWMVRNGYRQGFALTAAGAACVAASHIAFWVWVYPANQAMFAMAITMPPADWVGWRNQWEYTHTIRFGLMLAGLALLSWPVDEASTT